MSNLKQMLIDIKTEKDTKIIPQNIRAGVNIYGVTGTLDPGETPAGDSEIMWFYDDEQGVFDFAIYYPGWDQELYEQISQVVTENVRQIMGCIYFQDAETAAQNITEYATVEDFRNLVKILYFNDPETDYPVINQILTPDGGGLGYLQFNVRDEYGDDVSIWSSTECYALNICVAEDEETHEEYLDVYGIYKMIDTYECNALPGDVLNGKIFASQGQIMEGTSNLPPAVSLVLSWDSTNNVWYNDDADTVNALYTLKQLPENFILPVGANSIKYTYTAIFGSHYDPDSGDSTPLLITFYADTENKTARYSFQEDEPSQNHLLELWDVEFDLDIYQ